MKLIIHLLNAIIYGQWGYQYTNLGIKLHLMDCYYDERFIVFHLHHIKIYCKY